MVPGSPVAEERTVDNRFATVVGSNIERGPFVLIPPTVGHGFVTRGPCVKLPYKDHLANFTGCLGIFNGRRQDRQVVVCPCLLTT